MRPRFRITTFFWLTLLVTAFFCGRRSPEIETTAKYWWQVTRVRWGASVAKTEIIPWPPGSITINEVNPIRLAATNDPTISSVSFHGPHQLCISPKSDGKNRITYTFNAGQYKTAAFDLNVENGRVNSDWSLEQR